mgnify:FL=1
MNRLNDPRLQTLTEWAEKNDHSISVTGLSGTSLIYFFAETLTRVNRPCLAILPDRKEASKAFKELRFFLEDPDVYGEDSHSIRFHHFPAYDMSPLMGLSPQRDIIAARIRALYMLISEKNAVVITSPEAICFNLLPKESLLESLEYLETGEEIDREALIRRLEMNGYQRTSLVEEMGDYSVRGGVIDLFSPLHPLPVRLEFWGDHLESIREFDPANQRSRNPLAEIILLPASEVIVNARNLQRARSMGRLPLQPEDAVGFPGQEAWLNHYYSQLNSLIEYLPGNGMLSIFDPHQLKPRIAKIEKKFRKDEERFRRESAEKGAPFPTTEGLLLSFGEISRQMDQRARMTFSELDMGLVDEAHNKLSFTGNYHPEIDLEVRHETKGRVSLAPLAEKISERLESRSRVVITCSTEQQADRLQEILKNYHVEVNHVVQKWNQIPDKPGLSICMGRISSGFSWPETGLYVISENEIFGPKTAGTGSRKRSPRKALSWSSLSQLKKGDFVVHEDHGIGRYQDLATLDIGGRTHDLVIVEYADKAKLYIPAERMSILQKYAGAEERSPKLDQLGGRSWDIAKQKAKKAVGRIAKQLVELYALRKFRKGVPFSTPDHFYREFEATFEHEETSDQNKAVEDVLADLTSDRPMDRLICGDVGFGKTEIAIRAAFKVVSDGKQVAFLVPTTVLAEQHYETFRKRMAPFSMQVGILSRFKTGSEQAKTIAKLRSGGIDVLIGTHRILQKDVKFADLGLLIIDEEQRFGVKQKEALKQFRVLVDVLAITATPVPRTLQMSMMGVRDLSVIQTPPQDRLSIETYLSPYDDALIVRAIESEVERGGQIFFVHNRVRSIEQQADHLRKLLPRVRFAVAHGQMKSRELEETMMRFLKNEIDVLICTTIIESGLDIPTANTIIINNADQLGLAQIYQLRGRVGRAKEKAYAYLLISKGTTLTKDAQKRLKALMDFTSLGAGLHLAMHDLQIRGGGNVLGFAQAGHIAAVGYELYVKLIERAVSELKGEEFEEGINPEINVDIPAYLPGHYVMDTDVRLNLYRRLSGAAHGSELKELIEEVIDRFGPLPKEVENLFAVMSIRLLLKELRIARLDIGSNALTVAFLDVKSIDTEKLVATATSRPGKFRFTPQGKVIINMGRLSLPQDLPFVEKTLELLDTRPR